MSVGGAVHDPFRDRVVGEGREQFVDQSFVGNALSVVEERARIGSRQEIVGFCHHGGRL
ncbi:hypothetical protein [Gordonia sputi]